MQTLPIDSFIPQILNLLAVHQNLVVAAEPGAGKTTRLPPSLMPHIDGKIFVLEPRRMAAIAAAQRIAEEQGFGLGQQVGYQVRFDNKSSEATRLVFMTEALLTRRMLSDPELSGVGAIVLDEFHERSLNVDLALGMAKELQQLGHQLKIIVMSATLDIEKVKSFLGDAEAIRVPGKTFPLQIHPQSLSLKTRLDPDFFADFAGLIKRAYSENQGDVLAFLPGSGEIERTRRQLNDWAQSQNVQLHSLHGSIPLEQQRQILAPSTSRRIVLSTNVAESSVTVNGVDCVVDSGLVKVLRQDPRTGFSRLEMSKVSQASATQRAGRAARQRPGQCYRMWSANEHSQLSPYEQPEVLRIDISESLLFLAAQGVSDFANFAWFQTPSPTQIKRASRDLHDLGALDEKNKITPLGLKMLAWPLPPRLAKLMVIAEKKKQTTLAADLAALLLERDLLQSKASENYLGDAWECDLSLRWSLLQNWRARQSDQDVLFHAAKNVDAAAKQLARSATRRPAPEEALDQIPGLLLEAFADRLCRRRGQTERAAMSGGRGVRLSPQSVVKTSPFFLALDGVDQEGSADTLVSYACGFKAEALRSYLKNEIQTRERIYFDENSERFVTVKESVWRDFVFEESQPRPANANSIHEALIEAILTRFDWLKTQNESLKKWFERWNFFVAHQQTEALTEEQLKAALTNACFGCTSVKAVAEKDLIYHFESQLPPATLRVFQKQVPDKIQVPSGTWIDIHYPANQPPFLQVRLQELFGLNQTPTVLNGKVPIVLQLLAPNFRPVQTTSDLTSFWRSGYFEVRKELKIRYPKHSWPEDPLKAKPEAKGRRRS